MPNSTRLSDSSGGRPVDRVEPHERVELLAADVARGLLALAQCLDRAGDAVTLAQAVLLDHAERDVDVVGPGQVAGRAHEGVVVEHVEDAGDGHEDVVLAPAARSRPSPGRRACGRACGRGCAGGCGCGGCRCGRRRRRTATRRPRPVARLPWWACAVLLPSRCGPAAVLLVVPCWRSCGLLAVVLLPVAAGVVLLAVLLPVLLAVVALLPVALLAVACWRSPALLAVAAGVPLAVAAHAAGPALTVALAPVDGGLGELDALRQARLLGEAGSGSRAPRGCGRAARAALLGAR